MDLRKCCRVRGLDENLEHCIHVSGRNQITKYSRWEPGRYPSGGHLSHSSMSSDDGRWFNDPYMASGEKSGQALCHHGIQGQKWGVITKEYQPVAVDHRKTGNSSVVRPKVRINLRNRLARERAERQKEYRETLEIHQAQREKRRKAIRIGGTALGIGVLGLAAYKGLKVSGIKPSQTYHNALNSLTALKPTKARFGKAFGSGFTLLTAKEQNRNTGLARVLATFKRAGGIFSLSSYRQKIRKAREYIHKMKGFSLNKIS